MSTSTFPHHCLTVVTGLSGSGKSSLAFDTVYAEGQRRYVETFSPYTRQFLERMDKPDVDRIDGLPPAIAIEQSNSVKNVAQHRRYDDGNRRPPENSSSRALATLTCPHCGRQECGRWARRRSPSRSSPSETAAKVLVGFTVPMPNRPSLAAAPRHAQAAGIPPRLFKWRNPPNG